MSGVRSSDASASAFAPSPSTPPQQPRPRRPSLASPTHPALASRRMTSPALPPLPSLPPPSNLPHSDHPHILQSILLSASSFASPSEAALQTLPLPLPTFVPPPPLPLSNPASPPQPAASPPSPPASAPPSPQPITHQQPPAPAPSHPPSSILVHHSPQLHHQNSQPPLLNHQPQRRASTHSTHSSRPPAQQHSKTNIPSSTTQRIAASASATSHPPSHSQSPPGHLHHPTPPPPSSVPPHQHPPHPHHPANSSPQPSFLSYIQTTNDSFASYFYANQYNRNHPNHANNPPDTPLTFSGRMKRLLVAPFVAFEHAALDYRTAFAALGFHTALHILISLLILLRPPHLISSLAPTPNTALSAGLAIILLLRAPVSVIGGITVRWARAQGGAERGGGGGASGAGEPHSKETKDGEGTGGVQWGTLGHPRGALPAAAVASSSPQPHHRFHTTPAAIAIAVAASPPPAHTALASTTSSHRTPSSPSPSPPSPTPSRLPRTTTASSVVAHMGSIYSTLSISGTSVFSALSRSISFGRIGGGGSLRIAGAGAGVGPAGSWWPEWREGDGGGGGGGRDGTRGKGGYGGRGEKERFGAREEARDGGGMGGKVLVGFWTYMSLSIVLSVLLAIVCSCTVDIKDTLVVSCGVCTDACAPELNVAIEQLIWSCYANNTLGNGMGCLECLSPTFNSTTPSVLATDSDTLDRVLVVLWGAMVVDLLVLHILVSHFLPTLRTLKNPTPHSRHPRSGKSHLPPRSLNVTESTGSVAGGTDHGFKGASWRAGTLERRQSDAPWGWGGGAGVSASASGASEGVGMGQGEGEGTVSGVFVNSTSAGTMPMGGGTVGRRAGGVGALVKGSGSDDSAGDRKGPGVGGGNGIEANTGNLPGAGLARAGTLERRRSDVPGGTLERRREGDALRRMSLMSEAMAAAAVAAAQQGQHSGVGSGGVVGNGSGSQGVR
ncbi:hypothetical protein HDU93_008849 [Gonapodya sp. JEL0774]|nr:hypothetical protein HDU93_008849 [Gonapodya sp. JEL0774]